MGVYITLMKTLEDLKHHRIRTIYKNLAHDMKRNGFSDEEINKKAHELFDASQAPTLKQEFDRMIFKRFGLDKLSALIFPKKGKL